MMQLFPHHVLSSLTFICFKSYGVVRYKCSHTTTKFDFGIKIYPDSLYTIIHVTIVQFSFLTQLLETGTETILLCMYVASLRLQTGQSLLCNETNS